MFVALKPQKIGDEIRQPGELIPEAINWKRRAMVNMRSIADMSETQLLAYHRDRFEKLHTVEHLEAYGELIQPQFDELGEEFADNVSTAYGARMSALEAMASGDEEALAEARDVLAPPVPTPEDDIEELPTGMEDATGTESPPLEEDLELDGENETPDGETPDGETPSEDGDESSEDGTTASELACPMDDCEFVGSSPRALASHARKHK